MRSRIKLFRRVWKIVRGTSKVKFFFVVLAKVVLRIQVPATYTVSVDGQTAQLFLRGTVNDFDFLASIWEGEYDVALDEPKLILDLGAHVGIASIWFLLKYPGVTVEAYEPSPELFPILAKNLSQFGRRAVAHQVAASHDGRMDLFLADEFNTTMTSTAFKPTNKRITVPSRSLDTIVGDRIVDLLKIDIEGSEYELFLHAHCLPHIRAITGELHSGAYPNKVNDDIFKLLTPFHIIEKSDAIFVSRAHV
ncbi:MAG: FkbM family methyltransferase [Patescibacteria group bacterium]